MGGRAQSVQVQLPLWNNVIFVDWHGVLCRDFFWGSILSNPKHRWRRKLEINWRTLLAADSSALLRAWMRGAVDSEAISGLMARGIGNPAAASSLRKKLTQDCRRMSCDAVLADTLLRVRSQAFIVLATDNMDCFRDVYKTRPDLRRLFDALLCSCELGILKLDDPLNFFSKWLDAHELSFGDAVLIDDCEETCKRFADLGGRSIHYAGAEDADSSLSHWLQTRRAGTTRAISVPTSPAVTT
jgi:FMN phosphatase YigB (HAD superfamily)